MKKLFLLISSAMIMSLFLSGSSVSAAELSAADAKLIKSVGVPLFDDAVFVNGNRDVGFRFATAKPPEEVRSWYTQQLGSWSLYEEYGGWILYEGAAGAGMGEVMSKKQVSVKENEQMHDWFGIAKEMSTEIVIMIPR